VHLDAHDILTMTALDNVLKKERRALTRTSHDTSEATDEGVPE